MTNYKLTLNLPKTKFKMRGNLTKKEPKILDNWNNNDLYNIIRSAKKGKKIFILHDGPPYANGNIHIGHSVNKILKDIIIKSKGLDGFDSPYIPGWDCHGLPIELKIEQKYGKPGEKITDTEFRIKCREYASMQVNIQRKDFARLGIIGDWKNPYLTMDFKTEANIIRTLGNVIANGHLKRGIKPVYWCIDCCSALAEAEVEYNEKSSESIYLMFNAVNSKIIKDKLKLSKLDNSIALLIWTTTPWTLPANRAICMSPNIKYVLIKLKDKAIILAKELLNNVMKHINISDYTLISTFNSQDLELIRFKHPFLNIDVPVILSTHVTLNMGTGIVHIAGGHGQEDYDVSIKYNLDIVNLVKKDGTYIDKVHPLLNCVNIFKANNIIINILRNNGKLLYSERIKHNYPHCWRHKTPVIFRTTPQWFISMDQKELRKKLLKKIKDIEWIPDWGQECIASMITNRPDWCISRQRVWGVPISLFIHKKTNELHPNTFELIEKVAKYVESNGIQAWWDMDKHNIIGNDAEMYEKISDTLDVWFDSGSTHSSVVNIRPEFSNNIPDVYLEGSDQHRGWFMSSLITSIAIKNEIPCRKILTHGFVINNHGSKMSKSTGDVISPIDIVNTMGADILRLWVASTNYSNEITISDKILKLTINNYRRIRNTVRFLLANLNDFDPEKSLLDPKDMILLDLWAIGCANKAQEDIISSYSSYNFNEVVQRLIFFCSIEMSSFYLDIIKDRQYTSKIDSIARISCQTAMYHIVEALVRWISPIISFTADEIWNYIPGKRDKYVFTGEWYDGLFKLDETQPINSEFWDEILKLRSEVNKVIEQARIDKKLSSSLEAMVILYTEPKLIEKLLILGDELKFILLTSEVKVDSYDNANKEAWKSNLFDKLKISLNRANGKKCQRCWHYTTDIGQINKYKNICIRCINNIIGTGEKRKFA